MNFTLQETEHYLARQDAERYARLPAEEKAVTSHYWFIERKAVRGKNKWIFVRDYIGTKAEAAELFKKHFRTTERKYRLKHQLCYGKASQ